MSDTGLKLRVVYRCNRCGTYAAGQQGVLPTDAIEPPQIDCGCYMGPRWERGVWFSSPGDAPNLPLSGGDE